MTTLVTGVRGGVGRLVAAGPAAAGEQVRAASSHGSADLDLPVVRVDLRTGDRLAEALVGVDRVFLYAAAGGVDAVVRELAAAAVEQVVVLSSASVESPGGGGRLGAHHAEVERAVAAAGLASTALRPNAFASNTLNWAPMVRDRVVQLPFPDAFVEPIHEADIADAAVAALLDPRHRGRSYYLTGGVSMTQRDQVRVLGEVLGRPLTMQDQPPAEWQQQLRDHGAPDFVVESLTALWTESSHGPGRTDGTIADVTGAAPRTYAQWVDDHRDAFA